eukprot:TRINITY_DN3917_c0_g1_i1.p1 TRINITY_DN3917_c0_g1~~TRINITY_DN3917_c0_g1_i1.p1  ORF type:complete len:533 (-),score=62.91 TRINITY_DN3917_c0_g1_i1:490-2049(-)
MGQGDEKSPLKPIKPLALRYNDTRRTLKFYKEQLKLKSKKSRLLILAIADKLNEKEVEVVKIRREADLKMSQIWHQLLFLQGNLSKEQLRLSQLLQDKENIIQSQRQEISKLRLAVETAEKVNSVNQAAKNNNGSFRRAKRERNSVTKNPQHASSTDDSSSSPSSTPKPRQLIRQLSNDNKDPLDKQSKELLSASVSLTRQNKFTKGSERPKLKSTNSTGSATPTTTDENKSPKGILKQSSNPATPVQPQIKPPVPSRSKINEKLKGGCISSDDCAGGRFTNYRGLSSRDSGNSSLDSSDPSSSMEWKLSVRSTIPIHNNNLSIPRQETRVKPPPPPRRSKSYERPSNLESSPDIQKNFEEYDLSFMDTDRSLIKNVKRVSFQDYESTPMRPLRKMPSFPILATETLFSDTSENAHNLSQVPSPPAIKPVFLELDDHAGPKISSFINDLSAPQKFEPSILENLHARVESTSVISKLLKESMITSKDNSLSEISPIREYAPQSKEEENSNVTKTDRKYYF